MRSRDNNVAYNYYKLPGDGSEGSQTEKNRQRQFYLDFKYIKLL